MEETGNQKLKIGNLEARVPVIQGGMGVGVSLSGLAGAVAAAGGVGIISTAQIGFREPEFSTSPIACNLAAIGKEVEKARRIAKGGILGVNIMVATRGYEDYVRAAVAAGVDLIISGAGLPVDLPGWVAGSEVKLAPIVSSVKALQVITRYWMKKYNRKPDLIVIEGPKAGGHLGFSREELAQLTPELYDQEIAAIIARSRELELPVVVAGGIYHREDLEHYQQMGAAGVQLATRFVTTPECDASQAFKQAYLDARKEDIVIVSSPVGMPGRAIRNRFISRVEQGERFSFPCKQCIVTCKPATTPYCITQALINAVEGRLDEGLIFCGENAWRSDHMETVDEIMKEFA